MPRWANVVVAPQGAGLEHGRLFVEPAHIRAGIRLRPSRLQHAAPGRQKTELAVARGLGIRRDHNDVRLDDVGPVLDPFRIPYADNEDDRGEVGQRVIGQPLLPAVLDQAPLVNGVDIRPEGERDDVRLEAIDHRAGLARRAGVRLLDREIGPVLGPLLLDELRVEVAPQLTGRVVRNVEQLDSCPLAGRRTAAARPRADDEGQEEDELQTRKQQQWLQETAHGRGP